MNLLSNVSSTELLNDFEIEIGLVQESFGSVLRSVSELTVRKIP